MWCGFRSVAYKLVDRRCVFFFQKGNHLHSEIARSINRTRIYDHIMFGCSTIELQKGSCRGCATDRVQVTSLSKDKVAVSNELLKTVVNAHSESDD